MSTARDTQATDLLQGERIAFVERLAGMSKRDAQKLVRQHGAVPVDRPDGTVSLVVVGEAQRTLGDVRGVAEQFDEPARQAARRGSLKVVTETQLWQRLGLVEGESEIRRLYTPAMLADLLETPVALIRRWHRRGLIVATREVRRLPYFDFQEVAIARLLSELLAAGCSPRSIEKKWANLAKLVPGVERPLAEMSVVVEGKQLLLRQGDGLTEAGGQSRIDFDFADDDSTDDDSTDDTAERAGTDREAAQATHAMPGAGEADLIAPLSTPDEMLVFAAELEDEGRLEAAAEMYRTVLAAAGPKAEANFLLAELLYRMGEQTAARERYYVAIEIDEDYVEARANLGCVLAETGQLVLAVAAFEGALAYHSDYPDVHYQLARTLDELDRGDEAEMHWRTFLALAPDSPWADEARHRIDGQPDE